MDIVADLVTGPFTEIIEKGKSAAENAVGNQDMLSESQKLVKGAERCLRIIEPLCARHWEESGVSFTNALKDHNEIADYRLRLTDMLWDFDEFTETDTFDKDKYAELRDLCKKTGMRIGEILKRMKLEKPSWEQPVVPTVATSSTDTEHQTATGPHVSVDAEALQNQPQKVPQVDDAGLKIQVTQLELPPPPPPPPPYNPWDIGTRPTIDTKVDPTIDDTVERRPPVSTASSPTSKPNSPIQERKSSHGSSRRLEVAVDRVLTEEGRYHQMSPQDMTRSLASPVDRGAPVSPRVQTPSTTLTAAISEDQATRPGYSPLPHPFSQTSSASSQSLRQRLQELIHSSDADERRRDGTASPTNSTPAASGGDVPPTPASQRPIIPPNFPPDVAEGIERVPMFVADSEGLIPVEPESSQSARSQSTAVLRPVDCAIGLSSSFYLYKGFCEGAKAVLHGGLGIKKVKKPGFSGAHVLAKCQNCFYELDFKQVEQDVKNAEEANFILNKIGFRLRFLQKSHVATKRADELLFGCVFCIHSQRTLDECDATVFFSQKKLFEHLARHPRPLPQVPGIAVVEEAEIPFNLTNNYDLHFISPPKPSPLADKQPEFSQLPRATATQTVKRMYGMRLLYDQTQAFELAGGARISGIEFPSKYSGEWIMGWHDGSYGSAPFDVLKLEPPPKSEIRMDTMSSMSAVARWRFAPKPKDGGGPWLKFDAGEKITNISWAWPDHWCWSGTNAKGTWGIFPQTHIDSNTLNESSDKSSVSSAERKKTDTFFGRLANRRLSQRPSSVAEAMAPSESRPSIF